MKQKIITVVLKNSIFCLNLNLMMFFFSPFYVYIFVFILWDMKGGETRNPWSVNKGQEVTAQDIGLITLQAWCTVTSHKIAYIQDMWSANNCAYV